MSEQNKNPISKPDASQLRGSNPKSKAEPLQINSSDRNSHNYTNDLEVGDDPIAGEESWFQTDDPKSPENAMNKDAKTRENQQRRAGSHSSDSRDELSRVQIDDLLLTSGDSSRRGSGAESGGKIDGGKQVIRSVGGGSRISRVDRPSETSPVNQNIQRGADRTLEDSEEREIALRSNQDWHQKKQGKRVPRYTFRTFDDCPCAFCRPKKDKRKPEQHSIETAKNVPKTASPAPIVIPRVQTEVQVVQGSGGVSIDSEKAVTEIPQPIRIQRVMDYSSMQKSTFLWRIEDVEEKIRQARSEQQVTIYSSPFYTAQHGYKVMLATCLFGTGTNRGRYLPIFFFVCRGKYDNLLPWPLKANFLVRLLDQNPNREERDDIKVAFSPDTENDSLKEALKQPVKEKNNYFGVAQFVPLKYLSPTKYHFVRDDAMFIQVFVEKPEMPVI